MKSEDIKKILTKEVLTKKYHEENKTIHQISKELNIADGTIFKYMNKYDIKRRPPHMGMLGKKSSPETIEKLKRVRRGRKMSAETREKMSQAKFKGGIGHKKKRDDGYIQIYFPDHPNATAEGYILEHVLIMECAIGRHLKKDEVVHHKNHIRDDNRLSNLQLMSFKEHAKLHMIERQKNGQIKHHTRQVMNSTTGQVFNSVREAADSVSVASTSISKACKTNKKIKGYEWRYLDEQN